MRTISGILLLAFLGIILAFALQNRAPVDIRVLDYKWTYPLAFVVVGAYVLGMLSGWSVLGFFRRSLRDVQTPERER